MGLGGHNEKLLVNLSTNDGVKRRNDLTFVVIKTHP